MAGHRSQVHHIITEHSLTFLKCSPGLIAHATVFFPDDTLFSLIGLFLSWFHISVRVRSVGRLDKNPSPLTRASGTCVCLVRVHLIEEVHIIYLNGAFEGSFQRKPLFYYSEVSKGRLLFGRYGLVVGTGLAIFLPIVYQGELGKLSEPISSLQ